MTLLDGYVPLSGTHDEVFGRDAQVRPALEKAFASFARRTREEFAETQALAELALLNQGVTFSVFNDQRGTEKIFPICLVPRVIAAGEWARVEKGLAQRIAALCAFLDDMYGPQKILTSGICPPDLLLGAKFYLPKLRGIKAPGGVRIPIAGIDLIRSPDGVFYVPTTNAIVRIRRWRVSGLEHEDRFLAVFVAGVLMV